MNIGLHNLIISIIASFSINAGATAATVILDMDTDPVFDEGWGLFASAGSHSISDGILTVTAPSFHEIVAPAAIWQDKVSNSAGWVIETRMRRDPSSIGTPGIWVHDGKNLFMALFIEGGLLLTNAFTGGVSADTSTFHTYRFEGVGDTLDVFVDGSFARTFEAQGSGGSFVLMFGDLNRSPSGLSISEWDYFSVTIGISDEEYAKFSVDRATLLFRPGDAEKDWVRLHGSFELSDDTDGIDPVTEDVAVRVGEYALTIPAGSFVIHPHGSSYRNVFRGTVDGAKVVARISEDLLDTYQFDMSIRNIDLAGTANPVTIGLAVGNDSGEVEERLQGVLYNGGSESTP